MVCSRCRTARRDPPHQSAPISSKGSVSCGSCMIFCSGSFRLASGSSSDELLRSCPVFVVFLGFSAGECCFPCRGFRDTSMGNLVSPLGASRGIRWESFGVFDLRSSACGGRGGVRGLSLFAGVSGGRIFEGDSPLGVSFEAALLCLLRCAVRGGT